MSDSVENGLVRRLDQIEQTAHRVTPTDVGKWSLAAGRPSPTDGVVIAPADLAWLLSLARPGHHRVVHEPRCNTNCTPERHHLTDGIGYPHLHRTDLASECGECVIPPEGSQPDGDGA